MTTELDEQDKALIKALDMEEDFNLPKDEPAPEDEPTTPEEPKVDEIATDDQPEATDEPVDLLDKYAAPVEAPPEQIKLKEAENYLAQEFESIQQLGKKINDLNTGKDANGVPILEMTNEQFSEYLQGLHDTGKLEQAAKAQYNRNKALDLYEEYTQKAEQYRKTYEGVQSYKEQIEEAPKWTQVGDEFESSYPGFKDTFGVKVRDYLTPLLTKGEPGFNKDIYEASRTDEGKRRLVVQALQALGLLDGVKSLANGGQPKPEKQPSAPDATTRRKRVETKLPERGSTADKVEKVANLSQKEFNKLSDEEITEALAASLNGITA